MASSPRQEPTQGLTQAGAHTKEAAVLTAKVDVKTEGERDRQAETGKEKVLEDAGNGGLSHNGTHASLQRAQLQGGFKIKIT